MKCVICRQPLAPEEGVPWQHPDPRIQDERWQVVELVHRACKPTEPEDRDDAA